MEAATSPAAVPRARELSSDKAARIVEAMRASVAERGIAGSTFDQVAREAGVSRGLLHYYFGTKERLLVEVVRRECDVRKRRLEAAIEDADSADRVLDALVRSFQDFLGAGPRAALMHYELLTLAQRNAEIASELAKLGRSTRAHLVDILRGKRDAGALELRAEPETVALFLFALADGLMMRSLSEPELDVSPAVGQAVAAARALLG